MAQAPPGYLSHFARLQHCLELRREGKSYQQIADVTGLKTPGRAQTLVSRAIKRLLRETAEEIRSIELSRLEVLIQCLWDKMILDMNEKDALHVDYRRFDRVKQLVESKLKWCGAQPVLEGMEKDRRVSITINSFVTPAPVQIIEPAKQLSAEISEGDKEDVAEWVKL